MSAARSGPRPLAHVRLLIVLMVVLSSRLASGATITWTGATDSFWSTASNWDLNRVPTDGDAVVIPNVAATTLVTLSSTVSVASITSAKALSITGNLTVTGPAASQINAPLTLSGTLAGAGAVTVGGLTTWQGGTFTGSGATSCNGGVVLTGDSAHYLSRPFTFTGNLVLTESRYIYLSGTGLTIPAGAVLDLQGTNGGGIYLQSGTPTLTVLGTLRRSVGADQAVVTTPIVVGGLVQVQTGSLALQSGGTHTGTSQGAGTLVLNGTHAFQGGSNLTTAHVVVAGNTTVAGTVTGSAVTVNGGYTLEVAAGATPNLGALTLIGTLTGAGAVTVTGLTTWQGGTFTGSGATSCAGGVVLTGNGGHTLARPFTFTGDLVLTGNGYIYLNGVDLTIPAGAILDLQGINGGGVYVQGGSPKLKVLGTLRRSVADDVAYVQTALELTGVADVKTGTLQLSGTVTGTGRYEGAGAVVFTGTTTTIGGEVAVASATFQSGTVTSNGRYAVTASTRVVGANVTFNGQIASLGNVFRVESGTALLNIGGDVTIQALELVGGTLSGPRMEVQGPFSWTSGTLGTASKPSELTAAGGATLSGGGYKSLVATRLVNQKSMTIAGTGGFYFANEAQLVNEPTGTIAILSDVYVSGSGRIVNDGALRKLLGAGAAWVQPELRGSGEVSVDEGLLQFAGGTGDPASYTGAFVASGAAGFEFAGQSFNLAGDLTTHDLIVSGGALLTTGRVTVEGETQVKNNGTATLRGLIDDPGAVVTVRDNAHLILDTGSTVMIPTLQMVGGMLSGPAAIDVTASLSWQGGTLEGPGGDVSSKAATISSASPKLLRGRRWRMQGFGTLRDAVDYALRLGAGAEIHVLSGGSLSVLDDADIAADWVEPGNAPPRFVNDGTFAKIDGALDTEIGVQFENRGTLAASSGTLRFTERIRQTAGRTELGGGRLAVAEPVQFELAGGDLVGTGTITGALANSGGTIRPGFSPGSLTVAGTFVQSGTGRLVAEIAGPQPASGFDQLQVTGTATLGGVLRVERAPAFEPASGSFAILTAGQRHGAPASVEIASPGIPMRVEASAGALTVTLGGGEVCGDGLDNDGNGSGDCAEATCAGAPSCVVTTSTTTTTPGATVTSTSLPGTERCDDAIDNDGDGAVDCADSACGAFPTCDGGCSLLPTYDGIECRLAPIATAFDDLGKAGKPFRTLARAALRLVLEADGLCARGRLNGAARKLRKARNKLGKLGAKLTRKPVLAPEVAGVITGQAATLAGDIDVLARSKTCGR